MQNNPHDSLPDTLRRQLAQCFGPDALLLTPAQRICYGYDNSRQFAMPAAVVLPNETAQVLELVRACRRHGMPIIARGRGTNTTGATVPINGGVVVSFERMNRLLLMAPEDRLALVEPGLLNGDLQLAAKPHALFWPPAPTSDAYRSVGGNKIGRASCRERVWKYV